MAYMSGLVNIIRSLYPRSGAENVPTDTEVKISFTFDMVPNTINTSNILILNESTEKVAATLTYSDRIAILKPEDNLDAGKRYQVLIKGGEDGIRTVLGDTMSSDYLFGFTTDKTTPVDQVVLVGPDDQSVARGPVIFTWKEVEQVDASEIFYQFQLSTEAKFGSTSLNVEDIADTEIEPSFDFEHDTIYYWRVRAYNKNNKGLWSSPWQFRYTILSAEEEADQGIIRDTETDVFDFAEVFPKPDSMSIDPETTIRIKFNRPVDPESIQNNIAVFFEDVDGIGEPINVFGDTICEDNIVEFTPDPAFTENGIYTVEVYKGITSVEGDKLPDDISWTFATTFTPYYSSIRAVKAEIGTFLDQIPDLDIAREILAVSRWADQIAARPYGSVNDDYLGETQSKSTNNIFYQNYVKFETSIRLLNRAMTEHMQYHGRQMEIGDLKVKFSGSMTPDSNIVLKRLETLRNRAETYLTMGRQTYALPKSAIKGNTQYPYSLNTRNSF